MPGDLTASTTPITLTLENPEEWPKLAEQIEARTGMPPTSDPEEIVGMAALAVALVYQCDADGDFGRLRGTFTDDVVAQCERNHGCLMGARPLPGTMELIGAGYNDTGDPAVRVRVAITVQSDDSGPPRPSTVFLDLQLGAEVTEESTSVCKNCGAPLAHGQLVCSYCGSDMRTVMRVPLAVCNLELF